MERLEQIPKHQSAAELASSLKPQIDGWIGKGRPIHDGKILVVNLLAEVLNTYSEGPGRIVRFRSFPDSLRSIFSEYIQISPRDSIGIALEGPHVDHRLSHYSWLSGESFPLNGRVSVRIRIYPEVPHHILGRMDSPERGGVEFSLVGEDLMPEIIPFGPLKETRDWHQFQKNFENNKAATLEIMARLIHFSTVALAEYQRGRLI